MATLSKAAVELSEIGVRAYGGLKSVALYDFTEETFGHVTLTFALLSGSLDVAMTTPGSVVATIATLRQAAALLESTLTPELPESPDA